MPYAKKAAILAAVSLSLFFLIAGKSVFSDSDGPKEAIFGPIAYRLPSAAWRPAGQKEYDSFRPRPDLMFRHRTVKSSIVRVNLQKTVLSPAAIIRMAITFGPSAVEWQRVRNDSGHVLACFRNVSTGLNGCIDARRLSGLSGYVLVVGGSWPAHLQADFRSEFDLFVRSFRVIE